MTREEIEAIRQRCEAATPGPWVVAGRGSVDMLTGKRDWCQLERVMHPWKCFHRWEDAEFAAHAREDIPNLLADRRELVGLLKECEPYIVNDLAELGRMTGDDNDVNFKAMKAMVRRVKESLGDA